MFKKFLATALGLLCIAGNCYATVSTDSCYGTDAILMDHFNGSDASTTITDSSATAEVQTANGNAQLDTAIKKFGTASLLLDGTTDNVTAPDIAAFDIGTANFTIDFWAYFLAFENGVFIDMGGGASSGIRAYMADSKNLQIILNNASAYQTGVLTLSTGTWYHFAITRSGTNLKVWLDGVQKGVTQTDSTNIAGGTNGLKIGDGFADYAGLDANVQMDELRIVSGTAIWTANFTPPSAEYTACASVRRRVISVS